MAPGCERESLQPTGQPGQGTGPWRSQTERGGAWSRSGQPGDVFITVLIRGEGL